MIETVCTKISKDSDPRGTRAVPTFVIKNMLNVSTLFCVVRRGLSEGVPALGPQPRGALLTAARWSLPPLSAADDRAVSSRRHLRLLAEQRPEGGGTGSCL